MVSGKVKEILTKQKMLGISRPNQYEVGALHMLYLSGDSIYDLKGFFLQDAPSQQAWNRLVIGYVAHSYKQQCVLYLKDLAGVNQRIELPRVFSVTVKKVDNLTVSITIE